MFFYYLYVKNMYRNFYSFRVKTVDRKFVSASGTNYRQTALISFFDADDHLITTVGYGLADIDEVYDEIEKTGRVILDEAYTRNFSLTAWRRLNLIPKDENVVIQEVKANNAFFDVYSCIDFSNITIRNGEAHFRETVFHGGDIDFRHSVFENANIDFSNMLHRKGGINFDSVKVHQGQLIFKNAIFCSGIKKFQYAHFVETPVDFTNCEFNDGDINMVDTRFSGGLSFKVARFGNGRIGFQFARFSGNDVSFDRASFGVGDIDFRTTEFTGIKLNFNRCLAGEGSWDFSGAEFDNAKATFKKVQLGRGKVDFSDTVFRNSDLVFARAETQEALLNFENAVLFTADFSYCFFNRYLNFRIQSAEKLDFTYAVVRDILDMHLPEHGKPVPVLLFADMSLPGILYIDWHKNNVKAAIYNQGENTTHLQKALQFLMIKENFSRNGQYEIEDLAYVEYRRCLAHSRRLGAAGNFRKKIAGWGAFMLDRILLDLTGLYGTSPKRVFATMIIMYALFSFAYILIILTGIGDILVSVGAEHDLPLISKGFYHSAITMLTIGYGDHFPVGLARALSAVQGFVGMLLLSYFTVTLVHKILR
jgi:uncharacterized protein YjbI with pentapeptide repeats